MKDIEIMKSMSEEQIKSMNIDELRTKFIELQDIALIGNKLNIMMKQALEKLVKERQADKEKIKELNEGLDNSSSRVTELTRENTKLKYEVFMSIPKTMIEEKIEKLKKEYEEIEKNSDFIIADMKALFEIQASIAKELNFDTDKKMIRFKDTYYVPDTMKITANIGEPKRIDLSYIEITKYLDRYLVKDGGE